MGKPKTMQKDLHTPHMCCIFLIWRYVVFKVSRLGVLPLILSQIKFANLTQSKGFMYYGNMGSGDFKRGVQNEKDFCLKINIFKGNYWLLGRCQKLGIMSENKVI